MYASQEPIDIEAERFCAHFLLDFLRQSDRPPLVLWHCWIVDFPIWAQRVLGQLDFETDLVEGWSVWP
jgi:hypothetical protein